MNRSLALLALFPFLACAPEAGEICGVSAVIPDDTEVADGMGEAMQDGSAFSNPASWAPGSNASVDIGTLSAIIAKDETGTDTTDLIERRAFPICVPIGERSENGGNATIGAYVSDASHSGGVAILAEEGGIISGRFAFDLLNNNDGTTTSFTDGVFRAERRN